MNDEEKYGGSRITTSTITAAATTATTTSTKKKKNNLIIFMIMSSLVLFSVILLGSLSLSLRYFGSSSSSVDWCAVGAVKEDHEEHTNGRHSLLVFDVLLFKARRLIFCTTIGSAASISITSSSSSSFEGLSVANNKDSLEVTSSHISSSVGAENQDLDSDDDGGLAKFSLSLLQKKAHKLDSSSKPEAQFEYDTVMVIGDLHSDVTCTKFWIGKTNLIEGDLSDLEQSSQWKWTNEKSRLVFMGDYIDKGPEGYQTLHLIKALHQQFPRYVFPILGNHELELLIDRKREASKRRYYQYSSSYPHPAELLNWVVPKPAAAIFDISRSTEQESVSASNEDKIVLDKIYELLLKKVYVYSKTKYKKNVEPDDEDLGHHGTDQKYYDLTPRGDSSITNLITGNKLKELVSRKLDEWQKSYINSFGSNTALGIWLESLPIFVQLADTIFVHGGIDEVKLDQYLLPNEDGVINNGVSMDLLKEMNHQFHANAKEDLINKFFETGLGKALREGILLDRSLHGEENCSKIRSITKNLDVSRIAVGHTPERTVRITQCRGAFLALDSGLGRWFRANGNEYCKGLKDEWSADWKCFKCKKIKEQCEGQIIQMTRGKFLKKKWNIKIIDP